jgi:hypothetical protein
VSIPSWIQNEEALCPVDDEDCTASRGVVEVEEVERELVGGRPESNGAVAGII